MRAALLLAGFLLVVAAGAAFMRNETRIPQAALIQTATPKRETSALPSASLRLLEPVDGFLDRITKKPFGVFITPETSPVPHDRFTGWHTGVDAEYENMKEDVSVRAIADGTVLYSTFAKGYGGVVVIRHIIDDKNVLALYGHLSPASIPPQNTAVKQGQAIGILGEGGTQETDGARKHLHFALLTKNELDLRGYVQDETELEAWYNPSDFYGQHDQ